ncbi:hypothetical protein HYPSUDRAFT_1042144 [Hypholoma sublateritium FD-334 SS-4]|uniref:Uncharacterized protein n=1 Tax=Hypholoma sublateritium (strain FD-334 SS-4) TaxID=945553 RepID=A0A0D2KRJ3_HYPSF|nr:hypothetical protein HYPSUDRAFT_1042144 [Hypholoma sublateritium FD-334 SS-4]
MSQPRPRDGYMRARNIDIASTFAGPQMVGIASACLKNEGKYPAKGLMESRIVGRVGRRRPGLVARQIDTCQRRERTVRHGTGVDTSLQSSCAAS